MALTQVKTTGIADDAVTLAKQAGLARGKIIVGDASGNPSALAAGSDNHVLTMDANGDVGWEAASGGIASIVADTSPQLGGNLDTNDFEISLDTNHKVNFGNSSELKIYHNTNAYLTNDSGDFYAIVADGEEFYVCGEDTHTMIKAVDGGAVELYHNNSKKFETTAAGATVTGNLTVTGTAPADATKMPLTGGTFSGEVTFDTSATASTVTSTLKAPQNDRLNVWKNNDNGGGSWYATGGASNAIDLQWSSYSAAVIKFKNAGDVEIPTGNVVIGTSGKGIDFSAHGNATGMTSELLDDYEEGTWTPADGGGVVSFNTAEGTYTKVGRLVTLTIYLYEAGSVTDTGSAHIVGLPFTSMSGNPSGGLAIGTNNSSDDFSWSVVNANSTVAYFYKSNGANMPRNGMWDGASTPKYLYGTYVYQAA